MEEGGYFFPTMGPPLTLRRRRGVLSLLRKKEREVCGGGGGRTETLKCNLEDGRVPPSPTWN